MAVPLRALDPQGVVDLIATQCFPDRVDQSVGVEVEYLCAGDEWSDTGADHDVVRRIATAGELPGCSQVTWEPGGQLELSCPPQRDARTAVEGARADHAALVPRMEEAGVHLLSLGMEPTRLPRRVVHKARYDAMEAYFDTDGPAGRRMMRATAALQVNLGARSDAGPDERWRVVHAVGPAMVAAFANSPLAGGGPTGWQSTRFANWLLIDPTRTAPVGMGPAIDSWVASVMRARVMLVRGVDDHWQPMLEPISFESWIERGHELGWPDHSDVAYHLTTLFPPVRARGWLEVRYIDANPYWDVAVLVLDALTRDPAAGQAALDASAGTEDAWIAAARRGCADPTLAAAADRVLTIAAEAIEPTDPDGAGRCHDFARRFPHRHRSPSHDVVDRWHRRASVAVAATSGAPS